MRAETPFETFCINLADAVDRRQRMAAKAQAVGIELVFVDGVDGRRLDAAGATELGYDREARTRYGPDLEPGEIACFASHRRALSRFLESEAAFAVVLEDDAVLAEDFSRVVTAMIGARTPWDCVRLYRSPKAKAAVVVERLGSGAALAVPFHTTDGAVGMLYSRRGAAAVLRSSKRFHEPFDTHLGQGWNHGLTIFEVRPLPVATEKGPSMIDAAGRRVLARDAIRRTPLQAVAFRMRRIAASLFKRVWFVRGLAEVATARVRAGDRAPGR